LGTTDQYLSLVDGTQSGKSYQALATQVGDYLVQRLAGNNTAQFSINTETNNDPGRTFLGSSTTRQVSFQGKVTKGIESPLVQIQYRWEGWTISAPDLLKQINVLSQKYGFQLYPANFLGSTQKIQMYTLNLNMNFYQDALTAITSMSDKDATALVNKYYKAHKCQDQNLSDIDACYGIDQFTSYFNAFRKGEKKIQDQANDEQEIISNLEKFVTFGDLVNLVGENGNSQRLYVSSNLNGFRVGSEILSDPISSNGFGSAPSLYGDGIVNFIEQKLGINDGEFFMQWLRDVL
jgi:hypothetical protein